ncbi:hypothetical protein V6N12_030922 [Hibiscus sabdariffa]|uniref:Uncharacterized protein n=1 Tax=Hibiscus sabdariffa TaxID=183260 RepID=A0ABR2E7F2_9ROSI
MAAESLLHQFDELHFTTEEQDIVFAPTTSHVPDSKDPNLSLMGCVFSNRSVDSVVHVCVFRSIWKYDKALSIIEIKPNFFLVNLASVVVIIDILKHEPWVFKKDWFALLPLKPLLSLD